MSIEELVPGMRYPENEVSGMWGEIEYDGEPWTRNVSRPNTITHGLANRHLSLWASHGMYFDQKKTDGNGSVPTSSVLQRTFSHRPL